jgi:hypothetical protein
MALIPRIFQGETDFPRSGVHPPTIIGRNRHPSVLVLTAASEGVIFSSENHWAYFGTNSVSLFVLPVK